MAIITTVLDPAAAAALHDRLAQASWVDGNVTSGSGAALAKRNRQLADGPALTAARDTVRRALAADALFLSAALPRHIVPPLFNLYGVGDSFGQHVDNAIRLNPDNGEQVRTDLSATLFLTDPGDYDGGELVIAEAFGEQRYKLPAGQMLLYPASSLHHVTPVTRGARLSCFFWVQSLVRDTAMRDSLFDLDQSVQQLAAIHGLDHDIVLRLTRLYHNLVRQHAA